MGKQYLSMGSINMLVFVCVVVFTRLGAFGYLPVSKEHFLTDSLLREVVDRMGRDLAESYLEYPPSGNSPHGLNMGSLMSRADKELEDTPFYQDSPNPSLRDQEYLQHSTLWGHQYMTGGAGEGKQRLKPDGTVQNQKQVKTDATLPAYCNPPNPCPEGYSGSEDGCLEHFENTAAFSREYQASQDCMCDSEHMFDCSARETQNNDLSDSELRFVEQFQVEDRHKNLVAKKFHVKKDTNPFLHGERLPVAAKKGLNVVY